ncbi:MAG: HEAT repeat domain-containing protein, partial [Candidatus Edwardsbacteria bacterium]|nr:HEAT repeat domain-containing protein [Candidatus Edwardsbacteria bacterium]
LKGALAMTDPEQSQQMLAAELDRIAGIARTQGGSDYVNQMASVIGSMDQKNGQWAAQVKLDNPEWRDVIRELLDRYSDEDVARLIVNKAEVMCLELADDDLIRNEKLKTMIESIPIPHPRKEALYPLASPKLMKYGLNQDDCDYVFGKALDTQPMLERYLGDLKTRPPAEMLGADPTKVLRFLLLREEGCRPAFEGFLKILADPDTGVRGAALAKTGELLPDLLAVERYDLVELLIDALTLRLKQEVDPAHYPLVLTAIERIADSLIQKQKHALASRISQHISELLLLLADRPIAADMIRILDKIGDEPAIKALIQALLKDAVFEQVSAVLIQKGEKAVPHLLQVVKESEDKDMRLKCLYVMDKIKTGVEQQAIWALADERWFVRRNMCLLLALQGTKASLVPLAATLDDKNARVRLEGLRALFKVGAQNSEAWLIKAASDKEPEIKKEAISYLGQVGTEASVDALSELYVKKDLLGRTEPSEVKKLIVTALGKIGTKNAASFMMKVARDRDADMSAFAQRALQELLKRLKAKEPGAA